MIASSSDWLASVLEGETYGLPEAVLRSILTQPSRGEGGEPGMLYLGPQQWRAPPNAQSAFNVENGGVPREDDLIQLLALGRMLQQQNAPRGETYGVTPSPFRQPTQPDLPAQLRALLGGY